MRHRLCLCLVVLFIGSLALSCTGGPPTPSPKDVPRMTREELKPLLGNPDVVVIDVRQPDDWMPAKLKIKGAVRETGPVASWANRYPRDKTLVFY